MKNSHNDTNIVEESKINKNIDTNIKETKALIERKFKKNAHKGILDIDSLQMIVTPPSELYDAVESNTKEDTDKKNKQHEPQKTNIIKINKNNFESSSKLQSNVSNKNLLNNKRYNSNISNKNSKNKIANINYTNYIKPINYNNHNLLNTVECHQCKNDVPLSSVLNCINASCFNSYCITCTSKYQKNIKFAECYSCKGLCFCSECQEYYKLKQEDPNYVVKKEPDIQDKSKIKSQKVVNLNGFTIIEQGYKKNDNSQESSYYYEEDSSIIKNNNKIDNSKSQNNSDEKNNEEFQTEINIPLVSESNQESLNNDVEDNENNTSSYNCKKNNSLKNSNKHKNTLGKRKLNELDISNSNINKSIDKNNNTVNACSEVNNFFPKSIFDNKMKIESMIQRVNAKNFVKSKTKIKRECYICKNPSVIADYKFKCFTDFIVFIYNYSLNKQKELESKSKNEDNSNDNKNLAIKENIEYIKEYYNNYFLKLYSDLSQNYKTIKYFCKICLDNKLQTENGFFDMYNYMIGLNFRSEFYPKYINNNIVFSYNNDTNQKLNQNTDFNNKLNENLFHYNNNINKNVNLNKENSVCNTMTLNDPTVKSFNNKFDNAIYAKNNTHNNNINNNKNLNLLFNSENLRKKKIKETIKLSESNEKLLYNNGENNKTNNNACFNNNNLNHLNNKNDVKVNNNINNNIKLSNNYAYNNKKYNEDKYNKYYNNDYYNNLNIKNLSNIYNLGIQTDINNIPNFKNNNVNNLSNNLGNNINNNFDLNNLTSNQLNSLLCNLLNENSVKNNSNQNLFENLNNNMNNNNNINNNSNNIILEQILASNILNNRYNPSFLNNQANINAQNFNLHNLLSNNLYSNNFNNNYQNNQFNQVDNNINTNNLKYEMIKQFLIEKEKYINENNQNINNVQNLQNILSKNFNNKESFNNNNNSNNYINNNVTIENSQAIPFNDSIKNNLNNQKTMPKVMKKTKSSEKVKSEKHSYKNEFDSISESISKNNNEGNSINLNKEQITKSDKTSSKNSNSNINNNSKKSNDILIEDNTKSNNQREKPLNNLTIQNNQENQNQNINREENLNNTIDNQNMLIILDELKKQFFSIQYFSLLQKLFISYIFKNLELFIEQLSKYHVLTEIITNYIVSISRDNQGNVADYINYLKTITSIGSNLSNSLNDNIKSLKLNGVQVFKSLEDNLRTNMKSVIDYFGQAYNIMGNNNYKSNDIFPDNININNCDNMFVNNQNSLPLKNFLMNFNNSTNLNNVNDNYNNKIQYLSNHVDQLFGNNLNKTNFDIQAYYNAIDNEKTNALNNNLKIIKDYSNQLDVSNSNNLSNLQNINQNKFKSEKIKANFDTQSLKDNCDIQINSNNNLHSNTNYTTNNNNNIAANKKQDETDFCNITDINPKKLPSNESVYNGKINVKNIEDNKVELNKDLENIDNSKELQKPGSLNKKDSCIYDGKLNNIQVDDEVSKKTKSIKSFSEKDEKGKKTIDSSEEILNNAICKLKKKHSNNRIRNNTKFVANELTNLNQIYPINKSSIYIKNRNSLFNVKNIGHKQDKIKPEKYNSSLIKSNIYLEEDEIKPSFKQDLKINTKKVYLPKVILEQFNSTNNSLDNNAYNFEENLKDSSNTKFKKFEKYKDKVNLNYLKNNYNSFSINNNNLNNATIKSSIKNSKLLNNAFNNQEYCINNNNNNNNNNCFEKLLNRIRPTIKLIDIVDPTVVNNLIESKKKNNIIKLNNLSSIESNKILSRDNLNKESTERKILKLGQRHIPLDQFDLINYLKNKKNITEGFMKKLSNSSNDKQKVYNKMCQKTIEKEKLNINTKKNIRSKIIGYKSKINNEFLKLADETSKNIKQQSSILSCYNLKKIKPINLLIDKTNKIKEYWKRYNVDRFEYISINKSSI